jgi:hypothetical protein
VTKIDPPSNSNNWECTRFKYIPFCANLVITRYSQYARERKEAKAHTHAHPYRHQAVQTWMRSSLEKIASSICNNMNSEGKKEL